VIKTVCEPIATQAPPANEYDAKFSIPFIVASSLIHGKFGLAELEEAALRDPLTLALADRSITKPIRFRVPAILLGRGHRQVEGRPRACASRAGQPRRPPTGRSAMTTSPPSSWTTPCRRYRVRRAEELRDALLRIEDIERGAELGHRARRALAGASCNKESMNEMPAVPPSITKRKRWFSMPSDTFSIRKCGR